MLIDIIRNHPLITISGFALAIGVAFGLARRYPIAWQFFRNRLLNRAIRALVLWRVRRCEFYSHVTQYTQDCQELVGIVRRQFALFEDRPLSERPDGNPHSIDAKVRRVADGLVSRIMEAAGLLRFEYQKQPGSAVRGTNELHDPVDVAASTDHQDLSSISAAEALSLIDVD